QALQERAGAARIVNVDRIRAARDHVVELARRQHVVAGQLVIAEDAARLAHADAGTALREIRAFEARNITPQKRDDLAHLQPALPFGVAQVPHARAERAGHTRRVDAD